LLATVLGWLANRIKAITGKTNWFDTPAVTLEQCNTHINSDVHTAATSSKAGIMSAADKSKLDGVAAGAQKNSDVTKAEIEAKLTGTLTTHTHDAATQSANGFMSYADKQKLDNATASNTANYLMLRDAYGRAQVQNPSASYDIMNKTYADSYYVRLAAASAMSAILTAYSNTSYTTKQVRNIVFWTSGTTPPTTSGGDIVIKTF
jgi:hypothetical protein